MSLLPVPPHLSPEDAAFLPNVETATNFVMDGQPLIGEQVAVSGQGIVGLLTTALFEGLNPSIEHFARILCQNLSSHIKSFNLNAICIQMWENEIACAAYRLEY